MVVMVMVTAVLKMTVVMRSNSFYGIFGGGICNVGSGSNVNQGFSVFFSFPAPPPIQLPPPPPTPPSPPQSPPP